MDHHVEMDIDDSEPTTWPVLSLSLSKEGPFFQPFRWCKKEENGCCYVRSKDECFLEENVSWLKQQIEETISHTRPLNEISKVLQKICNYFNTRNSVEQFCCVLFGAECHQRLAQYINEELYIRKDLQCRDVAFLLAYSAFVCHFENIPEDIFLSVIAAYVDTRTDQKWAKSVLTVVSESHRDVVVNMWLKRDVVQKFIDTYLYYQWW